MDFFSILLPGALLTNLLMGEVGPFVQMDRHAKLAGAKAWEAFLFASYHLGHLILLLGSWLDEFYDKARRHTLSMQITLLARRDGLLPWLARTVIWLCCSKASATSPWPMVAAQVRPQGRQAAFHHFSFAFLSSNTIRTGVACITRGTS